MKKSIFFATAAFLFSAISMNAQTTTWDFSANNPTWASSGIAAVSGVAGEYIDPKGLGLHGIATKNDFAAWASASSTTWADSTNPDSEAFSGATGLIKTGGTGFTTGNNAGIPTQRYFFVQVDKACTVKIWYKTGSSSDLTRTIIASDGAGNVYGTGVCNLLSTPNGGAGFLKTNITKAGTFFLYSGVNGVNIYKIEVIGANVSTTPTNTLGTSDISQKISAKAFSTGNKIYLTNLSGKSTDVKVYSVSGKLVKSLKTSTDTNFDVNERGLYFVNLKSEAGEKSIKVLVK